VASSGDALNRIAAYGVLISLPTAIVGAPEWASLLVTYLGGLASGVVAKIPGTQAGDLTVSVGQAVGEEFVYGGHTYNTQVITNTYYIREGEVIWTQADVTNAYPTSRTY